MRLGWIAILLAALLLAAKDPPPRPVNLNTATAKELATLPGIGPTTAQAIVRHRQRNGPFRKVEELLIIKGISKARLEKLRSHLRIK